jgi:uncharacterized protein YlxW (UPF0749 family)
MRRPASLLSFGLVLLLLGFLVVVQLRSRAADESLNGLSVQELGELVANLTSRNDQLREEIRSLERQRASVSAAAQRGDTSAVEIRSDLYRVLAWSGALGVAGPGVSVTIEGQIAGDAVEQLVNELRNAGAEALAVDDIRYVPGVVVSGPPGGLVVTGAAVQDPLTLFAVGPPEVLAGSLTRAGGPIAQLAAQYPDAVITVTAEDLVRIPATDRDLSPKLGVPRI